MSIVGGSIAFSLATFLSRIFGLLRDVSLAAVYGAGPLLDAYMISIIFPFFLRKIFGEGAMASAFVPYYKDTRDKDAFVSSVINTFLLITLGIVIVVELFPSIVPSLFSMGYDPGSKENVERLVRITVLFVPEVFLWAIFYSILNSHNKFFLAALSPLFMNLGVILGTLIGRDPFWSAVGFVSGGAFATALLGWKASKYYKYKGTFFKYHGFIPSFLKASGAMVANQFNLLVDTNVASFLGMGSVSYLQLSSRLYQLPLGLFGVAVSTVALSIMSSSKRKEKEMKNAVDTVIVLTLPASVGLMVLSPRLIDLIYGVGRFSEHDVAVAASVLSMYSIGVVPYSLFFIGLRYHHSSKRMGIPLLATLLVSGSNAALDIILALLIGVKGVALATSIAGVIGVVFFLIRKELKIWSSEIFKSLVSSGIMGAVLALGSAFTGEGKMESVSLISAGILIYYVLMKLLKSEKLQEIEGIIRRSR